MEFAEEVEDVERQPAEGEDDCDGAKQQVRLPLPATAAVVVLALEGRGGRAACWTLAVRRPLLLLLLLLVDHAVAQFVADAQVCDGENDEGKDVLHHHLRHRVRPLLHLHVLVLQTTKSTTWTSLLYMDTVSNINLLCGERNKKSGMNNNNSSSNNKVRNRNTSLKPNCRELNNFTS